MTKVAVLIDKDTLPLTQEFLEKNCKTFASVAFDYMRAAQAEYGDDGVFQIADALLAMTAAVFATHELDDEAKGDIVERFRGALNHQYEHQSAFEEGRGATRQ